MQCGQIDPGAGSHDVTRSRQRVCSQPMESVSAGLSRFKKMCEKQAATKGKPAWNCLWISFKQRDGFSAGDFGKTNLTHTNDRR